MTRVPVPDERDGSTVVVPPEDTPTHVLKRVAGTNNPDAVMQAHGYTAEVYEDDEGRYVGAHADVAPIIAAAWREEFDGYDFEVDGGRPTDEVPPADLIEQGVCPWCDDYEGDGVAQHASAAHTEEWADHTED